jgi:histidine triad (HIT) family protein
MSKGMFPVDKVHEDALVFAIRDIAPRAPTHFLVIPHQHIDSARKIDLEHGALLSHMYFIANKLADDLGIGDSGYRLAINVGPDGGQTVYHIHMHVLGGRKLGPEG